MVDETTDVLNVEQVVVCLRWVSECFQVSKEFVRVHQVKSTGAENIYSAIADVLLQLNLSVSRVCIAIAITKFLQCLVRELVLWQGYKQLSQELCTHTAIVMH